jgi:hypothetical protein
LEKKGIGGFSHREGGKARIWKTYSWPIVEMLSIFRTDPEAYDDKKQKHLKKFYSKVVTKIELD